MEYRKRTALFLCRSFLQPQRHRLRGKAQDLCPEHRELLADSHPHRFQGCTSLVYKKSTGSWLCSVGQRAKNGLKIKQSCPCLLGETDNLRYPLVRPLTDIPLPPLRTSSAKIFFSLKTNISNFLEKCRFPDRVSDLRGPRYFLFRKEISSAGFSPVSVYSCRSGVL